MYMLYMLIAYNNTHFYSQRIFILGQIYFDSMTYLQTNYLVMVTENCKKIEPVFVKLRSKTKYTTFFLNMVQIAFIPHHIQESYTFKNGPVFLAHPVCVCVHGCTKLYLSVCLSVCICVSVYLCAWLFKTVCLSVCLVCIRVTQDQLVVFICVCVSVCLAVQNCVCLSVCLSVCLYVSVCRAVQNCLSVCVYACDLGPACCVRVCVCTPLVLDI